MQVRFSPDAEDAPYEIRLKTVWVGDHGDGVNYSARLVDSTGQEVETGPNWMHRVVGRANAVYTVALSLLSRAVDRGACCSQTTIGSLRAELEVIRVPALAQGLEIMKAAPSDEGVDVRPFIFGGELVENGYDAVGALMFEEAVECSGTLIGPRTVLTAAHCVFDRREQLARMTFRLGNNAYSPLASYPVESVLYPAAGNAPPGFEYRHSRRLPLNDIALVYIDRPASNVAYFAVHEGRPPLATVQRNRTRLDFVGFGFNIAHGSRAGIGRKRHVLMPIKALEEKWIRYGDGVAGTCDGDSGGPAFLLLEETGRPPQLMLTGVTSAGPVGCQGVAYDTRVDAFSDWINAPGRVR